MKVIITGATGMVGEGVLHVCLAHPEIDSVLVLTRRSTGIAHAKLREVVHEDFYNLSAVEQYLAGYDACLFCLGVSSVGMKAEEYYKVTYVLTMHVATTLSKLNPQLTFCYISGAGTDDTLKSRMSWSRVKGKTENDLRTLPYKASYAFRPGFIKPIKGLMHINPMYKYMNWVFPIGRSVYPKGFCTMRELALAMIRVAREGYVKPVITGTDIIELSK